jgi:arylsulfatase A-like enzyme
VVLVVLDTVRADHLSCYGYPLPTTPAIDAVAAAADRYTHARATAPWTVPSHASMFTGLAPFEHGAQARKVDGRVREFPLADEHLTLAEALRARGYRTGAVVANRVYLGARLGFAQGFDYWEERPGRHGNRRGRPDATRLALDWIARGDPELPFFLFVNAMDAHRPYNVAPLPPERAAALPAPDPADPGRLLDQLVHAVLESEAPPDPELVRRVVSQYDVGLAHADLAVGELVEGLRRAGRWDDTLFVLTSDHGEYFGEHDLVEHSKDVYEPALAVPLVVKRPGQREGRVIAERVSLAELPALVAASIGGETGRALAEALPTADASLAFAELRYTRERDLGRPYGVRFDRERTVVYRGPYKAILSSDGQSELYHLGDDPGEQTDLVERRPELARELLAIARRARERGEAGAGAPAAVEFSDEELERLRELGYVDGP